MFLTILLYHISPLYTEGSEVEHGADDGERLQVVGQLAHRPPELPREREQLPHLTI